MTSSRHPACQTERDGPRSHLDVLRTSLLPTVEFLNRRRADLIAPELIEAYVTLNWMEWHGGSLRLTVTGRNICAQLSVRSK